MHLEGQGNRIWPEVIAGQGFRDFCVGLTTRGSVKNLGGLSGFVVGCDLAREAGIEHCGSYRRDAVRFLWGPTHAPFLRHPNACDLVDTSFGRGQTQPIPWIGIGANNR
jgi:hypothetical protein